MIWIVFQFWKEHAMADLIWNAKTREELRESLDAELRLCIQDRELSGKENRSKNETWFFPLFFTLWFIKTSSDLNVQVMNRYRGITPSSKWITRHWWKKCALVITTCAFCCKRSSWRDQLCPSTSKTRSNSFTNSTADSSPLPKLLLGATLSLFDIHSHLKLFFINCTNAYIELLVLTTIINSIDGNNRFS